MIDDDSAAKMGEWFGRKYVHKEAETEISRSCLSWNENVTFSDQPRAKIVFSTRERDPFGAVNILSAVNCSIIFITFYCFTSRGFHGGSSQCLWGEGLRGKKRRPRAILTTAFRGFHPELASCVARKQNRTFFNLFAMVSSCWRNKCCLAIILDAS